MQTIWGFLAPRSMIRNSSFPGGKRWVFKKQIRCKQCVNL